MPTGEPSDVLGDALDDLRADCARCSGLCCVAPAFARSSDFPIDKPAGSPCPHLRDDDRCGVHDRLRPLGFVGCTVYDCFGAGQRTVQRIYAGRGWRDETVSASEMFEVFAVVRDVHELLWLLSDVLSRPEAASVHDEATTLRAELDESVGAAVPGVLRVDTSALRDRVAPVLRRASAQLRPRTGPERRREDLSGRRFRGSELEAADLSGALLLGADLRGCDLDCADFLGTDLRGCDVSGADLSRALFLTQVQVDAARGDDCTRLPPRVTRPRHW